MKVMVNNGTIMINDATKHFIHTVQDEHKNTP